MCCVLRKNCRVVLVHQISHLMVESCGTIPLPLSHSSSVPSSLLPITLFLSDWARRTLTCLLQAISLFLLSPKCQPLTLGHSFQLDALPKAPGLCLEFGYWFDLSSGKTLFLLLWTDRRALLWNSLSPAESRLEETEGCTMWEGCGVVRGGVGCGKGWLWRWKRDRNRDHGFSMLACKRFEVTEFLGLRKMIIKTVFASFKGLSLRYVLRMFYI